MGADQALEWEVVTSEGKLVTATPTKNADLYWALSGGGGGTYGVVTSLTVKAHPDEQFGGANGGFASAGIPQDTYWGAVENFTGVLPALVDAGAHVTWIVQAEFFTLYEVTIPGGNGDQIRELLLPFSTWLDEHNVPYQINFTTFDNYQSHVDHYLGPPPYGYDAHSSLLEGGVMLDRGTVKTSWSDIAKTMRKMATEKGWFYPAYAMNASRMPAVPNAVLPGWRDQLVYLEVQKYWNFTVPFSVMEEERKFLTETIMPPLQDLAIGAYMNEADFANPRWKEEYYGRNYGRLRQVKKKYDPTDLLYAKTAVGSDEWDVDASGRLCRVRSTIF